MGMMVDGRIIVKREEAAEGEVLEEAVMVGETTLVEAPGNAKDDAPITAVPVGSPLKLVTPVTANPLPAQ